MHLLRRAAITVVVCLALPTLAACNDGEAAPEVPDPTTPAAVTPTQTPTEPPEPVEPELPEAATKRTKAGAVAFVQHYWDMVGYAEQTGETTGLKKLAGAFCKACDGGIEALERVHEAGGTFTGGNSTITESTVEVLRTEQGQRAFRVEITLHSTRQVVREPGSKRRVYPAGSTDLVFVLDYQKESWKVGFWERAEKS